MPEPVSQDAPKPGGESGKALASRAARPASESIWEPGTILLVDDSALVRQTISELLASRGHKVITATDGAKALWLLVDRPGVELVLLDLEMPILDGRRFLRHLRERDETRDLPVIVISAVVNTQTVVECLSAGASDFVRKPLVPEEVLVRVRNALALSRTIRRLATQAQTDHLTGLLNKRHLDQVLEDELERARRAQTPLGVIFADLDHFKLVNDNHGHRVGDQVLMEFSHRLRSQLRRYDQAIRYGGEEFVVLVPGIDREGLFSLAERLRIGMHEPIATAKGPLVVTVSLGLALFDPFTREDGAALINRADRALYQAKEAGRDRAALAPPAS